MSKTPHDAERQALIDARIRERDLCRTDLQYLSDAMGYDFVPEVHKELWDQFFKLDPSKPWALQSEIHKILILWSRGHYKTTAVVVFIVQLILVFPDIRILIMQGSKGVTQTLLHQIKSHFNGENQNSRIPELFPEYCEMEKKLGTAFTFTTPARKNKGLAQGTVTVASPKSIKTGQHYDIGFFDDLVNDQNYKNASTLVNVKRDFFMCLPLLDAPHYAIVSGTRYRHGDMYEELIRYNINHEWRVSVTDCWKDGEPRFPQQRSRRDPNKLIGFTKSGLIEMQLADPEMFSCQMLNRPAQRGGKRLTEGLLESCRIKPEDAPELSPAVFFIDTASTQNEWSNDSVICVGKHDIQMTQYVVDLVGDKWTSPQFAENIIQMALVYRPERILIEKTPASIMFVEFLKLMCSYRNIFLPVDFLKYDGNDDAKNIRIAGLEPMLKMKRLKIFANIPRWTKLVEQCEKWPGGKNQTDDYPDTLALMVKTLGGEMGLSPLRKPPNSVIAMVQEQDRQAAQQITKDDSPDDGLDSFLAF